MSSPLALSTVDLHILLRLRWYLKQGYPRDDAIGRIRNSENFHSVMWFVQRYDLDQLIKGLEEVKAGRER